MTITQSVSFEQLEKAVELKAAKDKHVYTGLYWVYCDYDGSFKGCSVRTLNAEGRKEVRPWILEKGKWKSKGFCGDYRSIYGIEQLKLNVEKPILFVEGEKAADAGKKIFQEFNVVTWIGGSGAANKADISRFNNMKIYLIPDNDENGYKAMDILADRLLEQNNIIFKVDIKKLSPELDPKWDIADIYSDHGIIDLEGLRYFVLGTKQLKIPFEMIDKELFPDLSEKGNPINTTDNIACLLDFYKTKVSYNEMTNFPEFYCSGKQFSRVNSADCHFVEISNLCVKTGVPKVDLANHLLLISDRNRYHPARDFILSKPWDGLSRINEFTNTIEAENSELSRKLIYRWMLGAVAAPFSKNGIALDGCLIIQGRQGIGKTHWFLKLVPLEYRHLIKAGLRLDPDNKDSVMDCTQCWLGELGEADGTIRKSHVSAQKQFITKSVDYYRVPFGKSIQEVPRRTSFYGSVNPKNYLADETGNRRYWSITAKSINHNHNIDMQQVWAEFKVLLDRGESFRLTEEEQILLNNSNEEFELLDPIDDKLKTAFAWERDQRRYQTCSQILNSMGYEKPTRAEINKLVSIIPKLGIKRGLGRDRYSYYFPLPWIDHVSML